jgi:serine protease Do
MTRAGLLTLTALLATAALAEAQTREQAVRADRKKVEEAGLWIYNDLEKGFAEAKKTGKPMLVILRCIPCRECVKLDDDLVNNNPKVKPLLAKFVRVRLVSNNGLDLSLFQFDHDQSFAAFLLNADGTIYGRFGTRSHRTYWSDDVSIEGLARALQGALDLHKAYPKNKQALAGKRGPKPVVPTPEKYPLLKGRYGSKLNYEGNVVSSCIHCHQVGDAIRQYYRSRGEPIPEKILFPYPHPKAIGLILNPREKATVLRVTPGSLADRSGFRAGDQILTLEGQPLLSIADVQWVLHNSAEEATLKARVLRAGKEMDLNLELPKGWRRLDNISWRVTSWPLRRMVTGGLVLEDTPEEVRRKLGLARSDLALRVKGVGQYGPHAAAKRAGFRKGDILVSFAGKTNAMRESDLLAYGVNHHKAGERVRVVVLRDGKRLELMLPIQN